MTEALPLAPVAPPAPPAPPAPLSVSMAGSPFAGSDTVVDPYHHMIALNSNDYLASISLSISTSSVAAQGFINTQVNTEVSLFPSTASLAADLVLSFPTDIGVAVPGAVVNTAPDLANVQFAVSGTAAGAQLTTTGHIDLVARTVGGEEHVYSVDFQGPQGILDFDFMGPNGMNDTSLAWAPDSLTMHTESGIFIA
jgi:hypothetical protein